MPVLFIAPQIRSCPLASGFPIPSPVTFPGPVAPYTLTYVTRPPTAAHSNPGTRAPAGPLGAIATARGQTMRPLALAWVLRRKEMTSALIGVRTLEQLKDNLGVLNNLDFAADELAAIDAATKGGLMDHKPRW